MNLLPWDERSLKTQELKLSHIKVQHNLDIGFRPVYGIRKWSQIQLNKKCIRSLLLFNEWRLSACDLNRSMQQLGDAPGIVLVGLVAHRGQGCLNLAGFHADDFKAS